MDDWSLAGTIAETVAVARRGAVQEAGRARLWRVAGGAGAGSMGRSCRLYDMATWSAWCKVG